MKKLFTYKKLIFNFLLCVSLASSSLHAAPSPRPQFFQDIMGMNETSFKILYDKKDDIIKAMLIPPQAGLKDYSLVTSKGTFPCGHFEELSIKYLKDQTESLAKPGGGTFNVIKGGSLDVAEFQADPANAGAVFQVASNFNGLETLPNTPSIETQHLTSYTTDNTQGPSASISAASGLVFRRYFLFHKTYQDQPVNTWGQMDSGDRQVNFLSDLTSKQEYPSMSKVGYVLLSAGMNPPKEEGDYKKIKVGYHANTGVTFGARAAGGRHEILASPYHTIDQVFTAAVDFGTKNYSMRNDAVSIQWGKTILNAAYEGTFRGAFLHGRKKVFLTLIGGGVFGNEFSDICAAIVGMKDFIQESGLEVTLIWREADSVADIETALEPLVKATGGRWEEWSAYNVISKSVIQTNSLTPKLHILKSKLNSLKNKLTELSKQLKTLKETLTKKVD
jgi:hypothetical protein